MAKFRIIVESIDGTEELDERYQNGIECDGFAILTDCGNGHGITAVNNINLVKLAAIMSSSDIMQKAHKLITTVNVMDVLIGKIGKTEPDEKEEFLKRVIGSLDVE